MDEQRNQPFNWGRAIGAAVTIIKELARSITRDDLERMAEHLPNHCKITPSGPHSALDASGWHTEDLREEVDEYRHILAPLMSAGSSFFVVDLGGLLYLYDGEKILFLVIGKSIDDLGGRTMC